MKVSSAGQAADPAIADAEARLSALSWSPTHAECGRWECDRVGRVLWSEGPCVPPHGTLIGDFKHDRPLAIAFSRRAPFRDVDGADGVRISGVPFFSPVGGRFMGYRGTARRSGAAGAVRGLFDTGASVDSFARMAHEVRTPLTAIMGFAQMIEAETMGAASAEYCERAAAIVESATRLLDAVDDLADAAQLEQGRYAVVDGASDVASLLEAMVEGFRQTAVRHGVQLVLAVAGRLPEVAIDERLLSRALDRTMAALLAAAGDETLPIGVRAVEGVIEVLLSRPASLAGLSAEALLDPARQIVLPGAPGPLLGLGFGLRLASRLVEAAGGRFIIEAEMIRLEIPGIAKRAGIA